MPNDQLHTYIATERARGVTDNAIRGALLAQGWKEEDVLRALGISALSLGPDSPLIPVGQLIGESVRLLADHILPIAKIMILPGVLGTLISQPFLFELMLSKQVYAMPLMVTLTLLSVVSVMFGSIALVRQISSNWTLSTVDAYKTSLAYFFPLCWVKLLTMLVFFGGVFLAFVPFAIPLALRGNALFAFHSIPTNVLVPATIIWAAVFMFFLYRIVVWYVFPALAFLVDGKRGLTALAWSRAHTRGIEGSVFLRYFVSYLVVVPVTTIASVLPYANGLVSALIIAPYVLFVQYRLYVDVKRIRGVDQLTEVESHSRTTIGLVALGVAGIIVLSAMIWWAMVASPLVIME